MNPLLLHSVADASGPAALGFSGQAFVVQLVTLLIVFLILRRYAFEPILRKLEERRVLIEQGVALGEAMRTKQAQADAEVADKLKAAREQADQVITDAQGDARRVVQEAEETARRHTDAMVASAHRQIQLTADRERTQLERDLVGLVSDVSQAVIGEKLTGPRDTQLIDKALKQREAA